MKSISLSIAFLLVILLASLDQRNPTTQQYFSFEFFEPLNFTALPFSSWNEDESEQEESYAQTQMTSWSPRLGMNAENRSYQFSNAQGNVFSHVTGNCTWYVYGRIAELKEAGLLDKARAELILYEIRTGPRPRHAKYWDDIISGKWQKTSRSKPLRQKYRQSGSIIIWEGGPYGHIGFVEEVSPDKKSFKVSHFNWWNCANTGAYRAECDYQKMGRYFTDWMRYDDGSSVRMGVYPKFLVIE